METTVRDRLVTNPTQEEAFDRAGEVMAEYARMRGVAGDQLSQTVTAQYTGLLADLLHYADVMGINALKATGDAVTTYLVDKAGWPAR